jgi:hypothetical protein
VSEILTDDTPLCPAISPKTGEQCRFRRGHDVTGEPHSWTMMGIGFPLAPTYDESDDE